MKCIEMNLFHIINVFRILQVFEKFLFLLQIANTLTKKYTDAVASLPVRRASSKPGYRML